MTSCATSSGTCLEFPTLFSARTGTAANGGLISTPQITISPNQVDDGEQKSIIVFINPKSGGKQGRTLLRKFKRSLNPRHVFDLSQDGPEVGLSLYSHLPSLRVLACGGDGTVNWILSAIDELKMAPVPPLAVLPLGTGNDLARTLGWGSGYTKVPVSRILRNVEQGEMVQLDRWKVDYEPQRDDETAVSEDDDINKHRTLSSTLPVNVFNNYFSLGADAATSLEVHESREANPARFNSRVKNKMFYAKYGGRDLLLRSWRDLSEYITLFCDGSDFTPLIRSLRPHALLFLNIPRYSAGTLPWGTAPLSSGFEPASIDDGILEVIGLSSTTLALLQLGGHGDRICQCRTATITTNKVVPIQIDGEPCRLRPCKIEIRHSHRALVVRKCRKQIASLTDNQQTIFQNRSTDQVCLVIRVNSQGRYAAIAECVNIVTPINSHSVSCDFKSSCDTPPHEFTHNCKNLVYIPN